VSTELIEMKETGLMVFAYQFCIKKR